MWLNENISYKFPSKMIKINPRIPSDVNITNFQKNKILCALPHGMGQLNYTASKVHNVSTV